MESLLDVILANSKDEQIGGACLCRLVVVCSFRTRQSSTQFAEVLRESCSNISGLMLVFPSCMAVLLEGEYHSLTEAIKVLQSQMTAGIIMESKVLSSIEGIPQRCSRMLYCAFVPSNSSVEVADSVDPKQIVKLSSGIIGILCDIATGLSALSEYDTTKRLSSLASYHEDLPTPEVLLAHAASRELPSAQDWLDMHRVASAELLLLDDEVVWPMRWSIQV